MSVNERPFRHLCPEADLRDSMSDGEFWEHVFHQGTVPDYEPDYDGLGSYADTEPDIAQPCEVCGSTGACGYDNEGRAMIHTTPAGGHSEMTEGGGS